MNSSIFFEWIMLLDKRIEKEPVRNIFLIMENCSTHGKKEKLPTITHVAVEFIPHKK